MKINDNHARRDARGDGPAATRRPRRRDRQDPADAARPDAGSGAWHDGAGRAARHRTGALGRAARLDGRGFVPDLLARLGIDTPTDGARFELPALVLAGDGTPGRGGPRVAAPGQFLDRLLHQ